MTEKQQSEATRITDKPITRREAMKRMAKTGAALMLSPLVVGMRMANAQETEEIVRYQSMADAGTAAKPISYSDYTSYASSHTYTSAVYQSQSQYRSTNYYSNNLYYSYYSYYSYYANSYSSFYYSFSMPIYSSFYYSRDTSYHFHANRLNT